LLATCAAAVALALPTGASASSSDRDGDGMPNSWEIENGLRPRYADARRDPDDDGLRNLGEYRNGADPHDADTDGDGLEDGIEVFRFGGKPTRADSDRDGTRDGWEDGDRNGILDEGEDRDAAGFVGVIAIHDPESRWMIIELATGGAYWGRLALDARVRMEVGCDIAVPDLSSYADLDVAEMYLRGTSVYTSSVIERIVLGCPDPWT
jgi:hypothetical protein